MPDHNEPYEYALVYPAVFSERQCDRILDQVATLTTEDAGVGDGLGDRPNR